MISRIFIIFLITASVNCLNYDRVPRLVINKTVDYRVSLRHILRLPEVNRPPFNLFKSREEFVKFAEQNIKNYKPYNYKLYRPYNPSKPAFIYDRDYVTKVLSSLGLLRPLQYVPSNPQNTSQSVITTDTENLNIKVNSSTESTKPVNNSFITSESNGEETTTASNSNEDINTTTNRYTEQTTDAAVSITEDAERTTELTTESYGFSTYTTEGTNNPYYSTTESVTESNPIESTTNSNTEETILTTTDIYTTLSPNTEDSSTADEGTIVQSTTDSFGIANTTYYSSTEPVANAETQYTTDISTTEGIGSETENLLLTNVVETTTTSNTQDGFNPTTPDVAAFITQFGHVPTSIAEGAERITELTTESFEFSTHTAEGTNIPNYSTTESVTESIRINQTTTDANTEETITTTTNSYTTPTPNTEDSSTADEGTIIQSSTDSFGIANTTDFLSYSSTEATAKAETQYTTEISTTERIQPENENSLLIGSNRVETATASNTQDGFNPTTPNVAAFITQFGHVPTSIAEDAERTTELKTESFEFSTRTAEGTTIPNYSTTESVTESIRINQTTTDANTEETTTDSYTTLTSTTEDSLTAYKETTIQFSTDSVDLATTTAIPTEPTTSTEAIYTTETSITDCMEPENGSLVVTNSNRVETTTTTNTEEDVSPTTNSYTEQTTDAAAFIITTENFPTFNALDVEKTTEQTTPNVWTTNVRVDGTDILDYSTKEPVTTPEATTLSLETANAYFMFTESNQTETATAANTEQSIPTTTDSFRAQTVDSSTTLAPNITEEPRTELTMENWDNETLEATTAANIEQRIPTTADSFTEQTVDSDTTLTPNLTEEPRTELAMESWDNETTIKTDILEYSTTESVILTSTVEPNDTMMSTIEGLTTEAISTTTSSFEDQTNANPIKTAYKIENYATSGVVDVESTTLCEETTETETIVPSETLTTEKFENEISTTETTEISIDVTTELNEKYIVNTTNANITEREPIVFSTTDNFNSEDSIGTTTQLSKEIESLADLLQPTTESYNEISTQAFDSTSIKDIETESTTNFMPELWNMSTTPLLEDITTEGYETEISPIECTTEIIEQVNETTIEPEAKGETFEKSPTELMLTETPGIATATKQSLEHVIKSNKGNATSRVLLTDDTTTSETVDNILETYNKIVPETFGQPRNQFMATSFQEYSTDENTMTRSSIVTTEPSNLLENLEISSIEPLYNRQQKLANKDSSKRKAKKFNYDTDVMPSLGDYDYI